MINNYCFHIQNKYLSSMVKGSMSLSSYGNILIRISLPLRIMKNNNWSDIKLSLYGSIYSMPIITTHLLEQGDETLSGFNIVWAVRAINGPFGVNCSKAIKFGLDVDRTLLDRFSVDAKKGIALRHRRG